MAMPSGAGSCRIGTLQATLQLSALGLQCSVLYGDLSPAYIETYMQAYIQAWIHADMQTYIHPSIHPSVHPSIRGWPPKMVKLITDTHQRWLSYDGHVASEPLVVRTAAPGETNLSQGRRQQCNRKYSGEHSQMLVSITWWLQRLLSEPKALARWLQSTLTP